MNENTTIGSDAMSVSEVEEILKGIRGMVHDLCRIRTGLSKLHQNVNVAGEEVGQEKERAGGYVHELRDASEKARKEIAAIEVHVNKFIGPL